MIKAGMRVKVITTLESGGGYLPDGLRAIHAGDMITVVDVLNAGEWTDKENKTFTVDLVIYKVHGSTSVYTNTKTGTQYSGVNYFLLSHVEEIICSCDMLMLQRVGCICGSIARYVPPWS